MKIARVALDVPLDTLFDYQADDADSRDIGRRVLAPLGNKVVVGVIVEITAHSAVAASRLKSILAVLRDTPALSPADLRLLKFAATYYHHPLGQTVMGALPARLRRAGAAAAGAVEYVLAAAGEAVAPDRLPARAIVKRRLFALLKEGRAVDAETVRSIAPSAPAVLRQMVADGWVVRRARATNPPAPAPAATHGGPDLTSEQEGALRAIKADLGRFRSHLLLGVAGSGKTEVYLHAIDAVLQTGRQTLVLVPEIALTPQLEATVRARFPATAMTTLHSGLNETERLQHWLAAQSGAARIVLGTRLAVFVPLPQLGLIIVDEEHDASLKQMDGLRYSARDLAIVRAQQCDVPVVLGSATPALETYFNAANGRYHLSRLTRRINAAPPRIECIDTRDRQLLDGLSPRLLEAIAVRLDRNEQSLVFINRRGFAPVLLCRACGWLSACQRCSANLVLHAQDRRLHCHHCGFATAIARTCPTCGNADLAPVGQGTQRIEAALALRFPRARILRIDRDSTRRAHAWHEMRRRIRELEVDILVGTQILAKGHDFPQLNLVGVLNADSLLYSTDFRAPERLFSLLAQVAGRAGRGNTQGEVLIQTEFPRHALYAALHNQDYGVFARGLLEERRQAGLPPYVFQALLRAEAPKLESALHYLTQAAEIAKALGHRVTVYDPVPAGMVRLAGRERAQLLVEAESRGRLQKFLAAWNERLLAERSSRARWSIDVDPIEF